MVWNEGWTEHWTHVISHSIPKQTKREKTKGTNTYIPQGAASDEKIFQVEMSMLSIALILFKECCITLQNIRSD